jgi:hypothetical protein
VNGPLCFDKILISDERFESVGVFDVDGDGHLDLVSGDYWYPGPDFTEKRKLATMAAHGEWYDDFSTIPMDVTGNGALDFISGDWWGETLHWYENPRGEGLWTRHDIARVGAIESTRAWDIDGDGALEIVPNTPGHPQQIIKLMTDDRGRGCGRFSVSQITDIPLSHGLGCGDIDGDGRPELICSHGWLKPQDPDQPLQCRWDLHEAFDLGSASVPILVVDVNGNGCSDLIVGQAHGYGLDWWEQIVENGKRRWVRHPIDPYNSQYHDLVWADIDGDGRCELITGKRYRAHCGADPGADDPVGLYYFKWTGEGFVKHIIDYGPPRVGTGTGIAFQVADLNGDGRLDVIAPGKDGLYVFRNRGPAYARGC